MSPMIVVWSVLASKFSTTVDLVKKIQVESLFSLNRKSIS